MEFLLPGVPEGRLNSWRCDIAGGASLNGVSPAVSAAAHLPNVLSRGKENRAEVGTIMVISVFSVRATIGHDGLVCHWHDLQHIIDMDFPKCSGASQAIP